MNERVWAAALRAVSVATCASALVACGGGSSNSTGTGTGTGTGGSSNTYSLLYSFKGSSSGDGVSPAGGLIQGSDGNYYGVTSGGGSSSACNGGCGTIFKYSPSSGTETVLYSFGSSGDGAYPDASLIQASDGNFYGTTAGGGTSTICSSGCGTIFKFSPSNGTEAVLYSFGSSGDDGTYPYAGLVEGSNGNFYGTTSNGGASTNCSGGCGTIFEFSPSSGTETVAYSFGGNGDGAFPDANLIQTSDGNLYSTASGGGSTTCSDGCGVIFKFSPSSGTETAVYVFGSSSNDGVNPYAGLIQDSNGNFYGTTASGGTGTSCNGRCGTAFMFSPSSGIETILYDFGASASDGRNPVTNLIQGADGNLYGTTYAGGSNDFGTVFMLAPSSGIETVLYNFGSFSGDGGYANAGLIQGSDGDFYGTTLAGGTTGAGVIFDLTLK